MAVHTDGNWTDGSSHPSRMSFSTTATNATGSTERMRIDSSGRLLMQMATDANAVHTNADDVNHWKYKCFINGSFYRHKHFWLRYFCNFQMVVVIKIKVKLLITRWTIPSILTTNQESRLTINSMKCLN